MPLTAVFASKTYLVRRRLQLRKHDGLYVIVHADRGGTNLFQCHWNKHERNERSSEQQVKERV